VPFGAELLRAVLEENLPPGAAGLLVALSGGADSASLLTALVQPGGRLPRLAVRAVHVDHGLQSASVALRDASISLCQRLQIPLEVVCVEVATEGLSVEAAARASRYRAFAQQLHDRECLLTAHHAQDQAETLLLQLLRGAGLKGLSAMPMCRSFAKGWHVRPLLDVAQSDLRKFGQAHGVAAIEDPMNVDPRFDRSYLRLKVWPSIAQRWPGAAAALSRAAQHLAEAQQSLDSSTAATVERLTDGEALSVAGLRALTRIEQANVLRYWLAAAAIVVPSTARLAEALRQILNAEADHLPAIVWGGHALRRYQERLFVTPAVMPAVREHEEWRVSSASRFALGAGLGALRLAPQSGGLDPARLPEVLCVRRRRGGETLKIGARARTHTVQHLCQSTGVLPWMRDALPLVYAGDALIAVGDLWQDARWSVAAGAQGLGCMWDDAPNLT
jgi:tRNA(Ile)-lysidine synthase